MSVSKLTNASPQSSMAVASPKSAPSTMSQEMVASKGMSKDGAVVSVTLKICSRVRVYPAQSVADQLRTNT